MGQGLFREEDVRLPSSAEEVAESLKGSLDAILEKNLPRVDAEVPPGFRFGFEGVKDELLPVEGGPTPERVAQGDRELAACLLMVYGESRDLCFAFRTGKLLAAAKRAWKTWGQSHLCALPRTAAGRGTAFGGRGGTSVEEGADAVQRTLKSQKCRSLIAVAPKAEQLRLLASLDERLGPETRIILLNARVRGLARKDELRESFADSFNPVFHLRLAGPKSAGMVFRAARQGKAATPWIIARRNLPSLEPQEVYRSKGEPSAADVEAAVQEGKAPGPQER